MTKIATIKLFSQLFWEKMKFYGDFPKFPVSLYPFLRKKNNYFFFITALFSRKLGKTSNINTFSLKLTRKLLGNSQHSRKNTIFLRLKNRILLTCIYFSKERV